VGPRDAFLDYAAYLFADEAHRAVPPVPSGQGSVSSAATPASQLFAVEEAHIGHDGSILSVLLSRALYAPV
jgi:hypothetical protein